MHFDFDLFKPTVEAINFIKPRLAPNAILLFDDYNFINQEGVKHAIRGPILILRIYTNSKRSINLLALI